jgi:hypothetical protein
VLGWTEKKVPLKTKTPTILTNMLLSVLHTTGKDHSFPTILSKFLEMPLKFLYRLSLGSFYIWWEKLGWSSLCNLKYSKRIFFAVLNELDFMKHNEAGWTARCYKRIHCIYSQHKIPILEYLTRYTMDHHNNFHQV